MKRLFLLVLLIPLALSGCQIKNYTPEITDLNQNAVVTSGDYSYNANIERTKSRVTVTALSTNAEGLVISFDGKNVEFTYNKMDYVYDYENIDKTNPAVAVYEAFEAIENIPTENIKKTKDGFQYSGKTRLGEFVLHQNEDNSYSSLLFKDSCLKIIFN